MSKQDDNTKKERGTSAAADVMHTAAGPWQEGEPDERGRYLVEYEQYGTRRVFVADYGIKYGMKRGGEPEWEWYNMHDCEVLRYAEINSQYA